MNRVYKKQGNMIIIDRDLNELDFFVKDFLNVLKKHSDYLIVSGFVSISTGRVRATEDVDILVPVMDNINFKDLFADLVKNKFWCYQGEKPDIIYEDYVKNKESIRFARNDQLFPNMEVIFIDETKKAKYYEFTHSQTMKIKDFEFKIPPLEFEIIYKEIILAGKKDKEDAMHLRTLFRDVLEEKKFRECKEVIKSELK